MRLSRRDFYGVAAGAASALGVAGSAARAQAARPYRVDTLASGLEYPWSLAFLPDGRALVTERPGRLRVLEADGRVRPAPIRGLPPVMEASQAGLMEVALDPDFGETRRIFLTFAHGTVAQNNARLVSARLAGDALEDVRVLFTAGPLKAGASHFGGRIAFLPDRTLVLTLGDAFDLREEAQNPANHLGKVVRLTREGSVPPDNPFVGRAGHAPENLSLGHRNVQGVAVDPADGAIWISEHGPRGGDELNRILPGRNYGWPVATRGLDYTFARVSPFADLPQFEAPVLDWTPSVAPSGLSIYTGDLFAGWRGDFLVPTLVERSVRRLRREGGRVVAQDRLFTELDERMRDVRTAPDGAIWMLTDSGRVLRAVPARTGA